MNLQIPETNELKDKYFIKYPVEYLDDNANDILMKILTGFDSSNQGFDNYKTWINDNYKDNAKITVEGTEKTRSEYIDYIKTLFDQKEITKLYFDNILIRDNWAAIHYRFISKTKETNKKEIGDRMQFLKFDGDLTIESSFIK